MSGPHSEATGTRAVLAHPEVRKLWAATLMGSLAVWIAQVALIVGVLEHHAGSSLAWVLLASTAPALLVGLAGGALVDRHDPRRVARLAGLARVGLLVAVGFGLGHSLALGVIAYAVFLSLGRLSGPATVRLLYAALPTEKRAAGNAALGTVTGITTVVGAAIGGLGVGALGVVPAFVVAAAIQAVAAGALWMLDPVPQVSKPVEDRPGFGRSIIEGFAAVRRYPLAASVIVVGIAWGLIGGGYDVLIGLYGTRLLRGGGGLAVGLLYVADGVGVLAGSFIAPRLPAEHQRGWYALAYGFQGALWAVFALSHDLVHAMPALFLMRVASGVIIALDTTLLLATVPDRLHGRVYALHTTTYGAVMRASLAITGALLLSVSPRIVTLGVGGASIVVGAIWWLAIGRTPALRTGPEQPSSRTGGDGRDLNDDLE
ncbi:MAG: MFS transporter [Acidimicrobiales bacterium]